MWQAYPEFQANKCHGKEFWFSLPFTHPKQRQEERPHSNLMLYVIKTWDVMPGGTAGYAHIPTHMSFDQDYLK